MSIKNKIGVPVTGEDFFGRRNELARAYRYLGEGQSLLLSAPRRVGKSSLAKRLISDMTLRNWKCIYIDLQGVATKEEFLRNLIYSFDGAGLLEKSGNKVRDFINSVFQVTEGIELGTLKVDLSHRDQMASLYRRLADTLNAEQDTLIVIDELTLFLGKLIGEDGQNRNEVEFLLNWFRSVRQNERSRLRWIFCGSVGLRNFAIHHRMSQTINDLIDFELGALPDDEAIGLILALAESYGLKIEEDVVQETLCLMQWPIPYFIQLLMDRLISKSQESGKGTVDIEDVNNAIDELSESNYFRTWDERLVEYRELEELARRILNNSAVVEDGLSKEQLMQVAMKKKEGSEGSEVGRELIKVLEMLEHDGYLMRKDDKRIFRSPLLRRWWKHKFMD